MSRFKPINFTKWIDENRELLKPPVNNKMVWKDREFIVMVVGGPNQRTDYHYNEGEELFYMVEGDMTLKVKDGEEFLDIPIKEGEMYLLPPKVPHSPQRPANSIGLVVERQRLDHEKDGLMWFCKECKNKIYEEYFHLKNVEKDLPPVFDRFYGSTENTTCKKCGASNGK